MTIIRCEYEGVIYDLDVLEETPIRLDISAIENDAIGEVFGAASQQFTLPGSKKNNQFFKHAYKVGADNVPGLNDSVKAWLISESDTLLEGSLYLDGVVKTKNEGVNYEVTIVNNIITFNEVIKTTRVKDLSWSNYNHSLSMINITGSWNNDLFGGDIFYPLVDFGRDGSETTGSLPNVAWNPADDNTAGFINSTITPIKANQFSPAIRVKTLLDKIFQAGEFTYETSLLDLFNSTYILPRQVETLGVKGSNFSDFGFIASKNSDQVLTGDAGYSKILNQVEVYDPTNGYNPSTSVYTIPASGTYSFSGSIFYSADPEDPSPSILIRVRNTTDNVTIGSTVFNVNDLTGSFEFETSPTYLVKNTTIELQGAYDQSGGEGQIDIFIEPGSGFKTKETPLNWETGTVNVGEQFDPQLKCIDILRGIIQKFNLVFEPDYTKNRVIKIETYDKWVLQGDRKDWSDKIQQAERIFLRSPLKDQPKTIQFEDAKDNDKLSKQVIDNAEGLQWGTAIVDAISDVPQGEKKVGEYFAPVILESIPNAPQSTNVIPQLYKTDDTQVERKTFKHKPRIGYKVNSSFGAGNIAYIGNNITPFTDYATLSNYDSIPIVPNTTKNLHWNDTFYTPTFSATTGSITAYDEYWNTYVNQLYNDGNKIIRADIYFEPYELRDIKLNDVIFVEDQYYRINKISGFNVNYGDVVSVELISLAQGELPTVELNCNFDFVFGETTTTTTRIPPVQPTTSTTTAAPTTTTTTTAAVFKNYIGEITSSYNVSGIFMKAVPGSTPPGGVTQFAFENETMSAGSASFNGSIPLNYTYDYTNEFGFSTSPNQSEINYEWYYDNVLDSTGSVASGTGFVIPSSKAEETWSEVKVILNVTPPTTTTTTTTTLAPVSGTVDFYFTIDASELTGSEYIVGQKSLSSATSIRCFYLNPTGGTIIRENIDTLAGNIRVISGSLNATDYINQVEIIWYASASSVYNYNSWTASLFTNTGYGGSYSSSTEELSFNATNAWQSGMNNPMYSVPAFTYQIPGVDYTEITGSIKIT